MSCFIEITNDLSELTHYDDIKKYPIFQTPY